MKKIFSILLCSIFLFNVLGYFVVFKLMQHNVRKEMKARIKRNLRDEEMEIIVIPNNKIGTKESEFKYVKKNEFIYKGNLYDIVRKKDDGKNTIFYCINDKQEEALFAGLNEHIMRNTDQNLPANNNSKILSKNIIKEALPEKPEYLKSFITGNINDFYYTSLILEQYIPVFSPPPKA